MQIFCIIVLVVLTGYISAIPTSKEGDLLKKSYIVSDNVPKNLSSHCMYRFVCKKKAKASTSQEPRECVKFCVAGVECNPSDTVNYDRRWCTEIDPSFLSEVDEVITSTANTDQKLNVSQVNMIDFPCQPGYLPDRRGRCREIW